MTQASPTATMVRLNWCKGTRGGMLLAVPRGFGATYRGAWQHFRALPKPARFDVVRDALLRIGYDMPSETVECLGAKKQLQLYVYALNVAARVFDAALQEHPKPDWLSARAWQGSSVMVPARAGIPTPLALVCTPGRHGGEVKQP